MKLLVTGGAGFIGSNFVRYWLREHPDDQIINLDKLTYAGNPANLEGLSPNHQLIRHDICEPGLDEWMAGSDFVFHFAAESHVDRSIESAGEFMRTNVLGTQQLLESARRNKVARFIHVSTDEVYGALGTEGEFTEQTPLSPNSPYGASKAASDLVARSYFQTYRLPVIITRACNNYGPYQYPEKFIPLMTTNALESSALPVYGQGAQVREWIYVEDHCRALEMAARHGRPGEVYNIGSGERFTNLEVVHAILGLLGRPAGLIQYVTDRPGHDFRYALDSGKARRELEWQPASSWEAGLRRTIDWYRANSAWVENVRNPEFRKYLAGMYGSRERIEEHP